MNKTYFISLFIFFILHSNSVCFSDTLPVDTFTFKIESKPELFDTIKYVAPEEPVINLEIDTCLPEVSFPELKKSRELSIITKKIVVPELYHYDNLKENAYLNLNNVKLFIKNKSLLKNIDKLKFTVLKLKDGRWEEYDFKTFKSSQLIDFFYFSLINGKYKIKCHYNGILISTSNIIDIADNGEYLGYLEIKDFIPIVFKVFCSDRISPVFNSQFYIFSADSTVIGEGTVDKKANVIFSSNDFIRLPETLEINEFYSIKIINQGQDIYNDKIKIVRKTSEDTVIYKIYTGVEPLEVLTKKDVTVTGKIKVNLLPYNDSSPLRFTKIELYEKEVGFFKPYAPDMKLLKLGETFTDTYGSFTFSPINNYDGPNKSTRDLQVVITLESNLLSVFNEYLGTKKYYKIRIAYQNDNWPFNGKFDFGNIEIDDSNPDYKVIKIFKLFYDSIYTLAKRRRLTPEKINIAFPSIKLPLKKDINLKYDPVHNLIKLTNTGGEMILNNKLSNLEIERFVYRNLKF